MYTVVLMAALSTSVDVPDWGRGCRGCRGCHGCSGCSGGCYGGCSGCYGGCSGCYGGCSGGYAGCHGCYGGGHGCHGGGHACHGGCYGGGCHGCSGVAYGGTPYAAPVSGGYYVASQSATVPAPATIVVNLPPNARLNFDGSPTTTTSARRVFSSPPLQPGQSYQYTLTAEIRREGRPLTVTQRINVRAGETSQVSLSFPTAVATASR